MKKDEADEKMIKFVEDEKCLRNFQRNVIDRVVH